MTVEDVVVEERFHGQGVGKRLLGALAEWAERQDVRRMDLFADRNNAAGLNFYDQLQWGRTNLVALQKPMKI